MLMVQDISMMGEMEKAEEEDSQRKLMEEEEEVEEVAGTLNDNLCVQGGGPCCTFGRRSLEY